MIKSVTITNHRDESITLELRFPERSGFLVQEITGLGPTKANINMTELSTIDGSIFTSARANSRNIVLNLKLLENPDIETTRQLSYTYFPIKKRIKLLIETDNRLCEIYGYVESNEPVIFSKQVTSQISIICPDPYFYSAGDDGHTVTIFSGITPEFEFPFSDDTFIMGTLELNQEQNIYYDGESEIGIMIYMHAIGSVSDLTISNYGTGESMTIDVTKLETLTGDGIISGDDIIISTIKGQKSITLIRNGVSINILNCLDRDVDWFQLTRGDNVFGFYADTGLTDLQFRVENDTIYEGV
jgi:hypothetical protein